MFGHVDLTIRQMLGLLLLLKLRWLIMLQHLPLVLLLVMLLRLPGVLQLSRLLLPLLVPVLRL